MANLRVNKITGTEVFETTGSVQFDGTGDYLSLNGESDFAFGTGDFTIEGAVLKQTGGSGWLHRRSSDAEANWVLSANSWGSMWFLIRYSGAWYPGTLDSWGGEDLFTKYNHVVVIEQMLWRLHFHRDLWP